MQRNRTRGFTLIELTVTLMVVSIVISIAVSSFLNTSRSNQLTVHVNAFVGSLLFARSEAIKRGIPVTLRKGRFVGGSWDGGEWEDGWEIFVDQDLDGMKDGNPALRIGGQLTQGFTLRSNIATRISFRPNGRSGAGSLVLCDNRDGNGVPESGTARMISLVSTGRVRIALDTSNGIPIAPSGNEIDSCVPPFD